MPTEFKNGRARHITDAQFAAIRGGNPAASSSARPVAAAAKPPAFDGAAFGRKDMLARHGIKQDSAAPKSSQADKLAALPKTLAEAKGNARAFSRADMARQAAAMTGEAVPSSAGSSASRKNMVAELKRQGMEPVR